VSSEPACPADTGCRLPAAAAAPDPGHNTAYVTFRVAGPTSLRVSYTPPPPPPWNLRRSVFCLYIIIAAGYGGRAHQRAVCSSMNICVLIFDYMLPGEASQSAPGWPKTVKRNSVGRSRAGGRRYEKGCLEECSSATRRVRCVRCGCNGSEVAMKAC
jgi:hypothetical protein